MKETIEKFEKIRDLEYEIPLFYGDKSFNCSSKNTLLKKFLEERWYIVNYRVCNFYWEDLNLPQNILRIQHTKESMHVYLEVEIKWKTVKIDTSWDIWLKNILNIPYWDWINSTNIAVKENYTFSIDESEKIMNNISENEIKEHLNYNRNFYKKINEYLIDNRI